ncbi:snakin-2-like protein [Carex littledalei]|uniref:Snakin-2-like protein n=1 Tax=Carex littledalei TaxID=544730 RepID=A0A833VEM4_9POAL|nr:snakin-2-like protein [Carex littledalei]
MAGKQHPAIVANFVDQMSEDPRECIGACEERCSLHSRKNVCKRACNTCCSVCKCVPGGTYGNRETCGTCYTDWTTHGNRTKCP